jgi:hypothetical protein
MIPSGARPDATNLVSPFGERIEARGQSTKKAVRRIRILRLVRETQFPHQQNPAGACQAIADHGASGKTTSYRVHLKVNTPEVAIVY